MANKTENEKPPIIVIKRIKKGGGGHHGGAWKVAYADFVTAMMAFFLLLWLLNVTTQEQKNAISNYFDPSHPKISDVTSGAGGLLGGMAMSPDGAMVSTVQPIVQPEQPDTTTRGALSPDGEGSTDPDKLSEEQLQEELRKKEDERFKAAAEKIKADIAASPELKDLLGNLLIDITPEGLRIQIVDDKGRSMFPSGSAVMYDFMRQILLKVTSAVLPLPNQISVRGHTDSVKYREPNTYDNWNLSADRAQASRRVMGEGGIPDKRIENVMGKSDREALVPKEPANPRNRRISIILLRERVTQAPRPLPAGSKQPAAQKQETQAPAKEGKLPGIQIVDDTKPGSPTVAGGSQADAPSSTTAKNPGAYKGAAGNSHDSAPAGDQELPPGYVPLPVTPGGTAVRTGPQQMTFGEDDAVPSKSDALYEGPVQSPYVNKPPTIRTPVFNLDDAETKTHTPATTTPVAPVVKTTEPPAAVPATNAPKVFVLDSDAALQALPAAPDLQLIQPKTDTKVITFGDDAAAPAVSPAPQAAPAQGNSDTKTLTFD